MPLREVACLFVTRKGEVLLASENNGVDWSFPKADMKLKDSGERETPLEALQRELKEDLDSPILEDMDFAFPETQKTYRSKRTGELTNYFFVFCTPEKLQEADPTKSNTNLKFIWTNEPFSKELNLNLDECAKQMLNKYGYWPEEPEK